MSVVFALVLICTLEVRTCPSPSRCDLSMIKARFACTTDGDTPPAADDSNECVYSGG